MTPSIRDLFKTPSALQLAVRELEDARRELLKSQTGLDYAKSMVDYNTQRVRRLELHVQHNSEGP